MAGGGGRDDFYTTSFRSIDVIFCYTRGPRFRR